MGAAVWVSVANLLGLGPGYPSVSRYHGIIRRRSSRKPRSVRNPTNPINDDAGEDPLGAKGLLRIQHHVAKPAGGADHFRGNNDDQ